MPWVMVDHNSRIRVSSIRLSRTSYYENSPSKNFFSYKSLNTRKGKIKYRRPTYKIRRRVFFVIRVAQVKKAKDFVFFRRATYKGTYVDAVESARAGLSPKKGDVRRKEKGHGRWSVATRRGREKEEKNKTKEGEKVAPRRQGSVCPYQEFLVLVHEYRIDRGLSTTGV